jgi:hypothetical protein
MSEEKLPNQGSKSRQDAEKAEKQRLEIEKLLRKGEELRAKEEGLDTDKQIDIGAILAKTARAGNAFLIPTPQPYKVTFPLEFYRQIYRLNNWDTSGRKLYTRPGIVGTWTNWMVYIKFPEGTIKWLREHSPSDGYGNRPHKFHQFMSLTGTGSLLDFIDSAIDLMKKCSNWDQFKRLLAKGYNKTYQTDMFDKDNVNWQPRRED